MTVPVLEGEEAAEGRYQALLELPPGPAAAQALLGALSDSSWRVRKLAAELLARADPAPEVVARLVDVLGEKGRPGARNAAAAALGQLGGRALPGLLGLLQRADPDPRKFAAEILGDLGRPEAVPALVHALHDPDANVRAAAAEALGRVGGPEAGQALGALLRRTQEPLLRIAALEGLASLGAPPPLPELLPLLEDRAARRSAWRLLGQVPHPAAEGLLVRGLRGEAREAALAGLGVRARVHGAVAGEPLTLALARMPDAQAFLASGLESEDEDVREGALACVAATRSAGLAGAVAAAAVGRLAEPGLSALVHLGLPAARALLDGRPPLVLRLPREAQAVAADAVVRLSGPALVEALAALLQGGDPDGEELALRALGRSRSAEALPFLEARLGDDRCAALAARALAALGEDFPDAVARVLERFLGEALRPHALRAFVEVAPARALGAVRRASHSEDEALRAAAAGVAGWLEQRAGAELLAAALMDEAAPVRRAAALGLSRLPPSSAGPLLERALKDPSPPVQAAAASAARAVGGAAHVPALRALAGSPDGAVALAALEALDALGAADAAVLERALGHQDPEVLKVALACGAHEPGVAERALALLAHQDWDVRAAAARALAAGSGRPALLPLHQALEREHDPMAREALAQAARALGAR